MKKVISLIILTLLQGGVCYAQNQNIRELKQKQQPQGFDNHSFGVFYFSGKNVYANNGNELNTAGDSIKDIRINPAYSSLTSLIKTKKRHRICRNISSVGQKCDNWKNQTKEQQH